jgi:hypothetical protein
LILVRSAAPAEGISAPSPPFVVAGGRRSCRSSVSGSLQGTIDLGIQQFGIDELDSVCTVFHKYFRVKENE